MNFLIYILIFAVIVLILVLIESYREGLMFKVRRYQLDTKKFISETDEIKLIFLSDLHSHVYGKHNDILFDTIESEHPDLILIGGDMLVGKKDSKMDVALEFISRLPSIAPVYYALGNHEYRMKSYPETYGLEIWNYIDTLKRAGVHFLQNESMQIHLKNKYFRITGLELPEYTYKKFKRFVLHKENIEQLVGAVPENVYQILLAHNPVYFPAYKEWGADLVFSGHLHGGMVRIPGWRGVITP